MKSLKPDWFARVRNEVLGTKKQKTLLVLLLPLLRAVADLFV